MSTTSFSKEVSINADKEKVWEVLSDFGNVYATSPNISKSYLTSAQERGVGTTRHCDFVSMGAQVEERIIEWTEEEYLKIDIYERKNLPMISDMKAEFFLKSDGDKTKLIGKFIYKMSNALGSALNNLAMKKMNEKSWTSFLAGIKHHIETGENVDKSTSLELSSVMDSSE